MDAVRRIVVGVDFSTGAEAALERALQLARQHGAALDLLHAFDTSAWRRLAAVVDPRRLTGETPTDVVLRERLAALAGTLAARSGLEVTPRFGVGDPSHALVAHVRAFHPALVVLARRADPTAYGLGSTMMRVLRAVPCPILVVGSAAVERPFAAYGRVLSAVDLSAPSLQAAAQAWRLFPTAQHRLLCVVDPVWEREVWRGVLGPEAQLAQSLREGALSQLQALATQLQAERTAKGAPAPVCEVVDGVPARMLVEGAAAWPADCVAVGRHGQGALAEHLLGSTTLVLVHYTVRDVLVVP